MHSLVNKIFDNITMHGTNVKILTVMSLAATTALITRLLFTSLVSVICILVGQFRPPLWSSGQSFWLQIQRYRVRFPALPDFLSSGGSGTGSTQPF